MMTFRVDGCPLCEIFSELELPTKLYYPKESDIRTKNDFVIVDCKTCEIPMVVVSEHITEIGKEQWGRILYMCRSIFGKGIKLRLKRRRIKDHWHAHIIKIDKDINKIPDLRGR